MRLRLVTACAAAPTRAARGWHTASEHSSCAGSRRLRRDTSGALTGGRGRRKKRQGNRCPLFHLCGDHFARIWVKTCYCCVYLSHGLGVRGCETQNSIPNPLIFKGKTCRCRKIQFLPKKGLRVLVSNRRTPFTGGAEMHDGAPNGPDGHEFRREGRPRNFEVTDAGRARRFSAAG